MERIQYSDQDFDFIRKFMVDTSGINLSVAKKELVYSRLVKRVRHLGLDRFQDYCELLSKDSAELGHCVNAMTTNVTSFFRENHHFEFLRQVAFPEMLAHGNPNSTNSCRIWSAGCSSGEEPYSIAMTAREFFGGDPMWKVEIDATDLDSAILDRARQGVYRSKDIASVDAPRVKRWFQKGTDANEGRVRIVSEIRQMVEYQKLNLKHEWPQRALYDMIFCRNVLIYFDTDLKQQIISGLHKMLKPGGYLFVGHSESLFGLSDKFEVSGKTVHKRRRALTDAT